MHGIDFLLSAFFYLLARCYEQEKRNATMVILYQETAIVWVFNQYESVSKQLENRLKTV